MSDARLSKQEPGLKFDAGKPRYSLVDRLFVWGIIRVLEFGARKYGIDNWRKGMSWSRAFDALHRHLDAWYRGEERDPETGELHLDHAGCCLMFLRRFSVDPRYRSYDDRHTDNRTLAEEVETDGTRQTVEGGE